MGSGLGQLQGHFSYFQLEFALERSETGKCVLKFPGELAEVEFWRILNIQLFEFGARI